MVAFLVVTAFIIIVIVLLNFIKTKPKGKSKSVMDVIKEDSKFQELEGLFKVMEKLNETGTDQDIMPDGYGEYGLDLTNPIPVNTVFGSIAYLGRLRTMDGIKVQYERVCSTSSPNIDQIIDEYKILVNQRAIATLYICPYNKKNSERPPKGFKLSALP
jgi:hypothetical protein